MCMSGALPTAFVPFFCAARLVALRKPLGGIRPIAVGEVFRRLVGKVLLRRNHTDIVKALAPMQVGVLVPAAAEQVAFAIRNIFSKLPASSDLVLLQLDFTNAFNCLDRNIILTEVHRRIPSLLPWVLSSFSEPAKLYYEDQIIYSQCGVQQGDVLGPLLFSLGIHHMLEEVDQTFHPTLNKWYLDDGSIVAPLPAIPSLLHSISSLSQQVGLRLNLSKCVLLHGPGITSIPPGLQSLQLRDWSDNGTKVLGTPIGSQRYTLQLLTEKFDECKFLADRILQLPHLQMAWRLLTHCSGFCKVNFLLRVVPYLWGQAFAESVAGYTRLCIQKLIGSIMSTQHWTVASLPISMGGMGVQDPMWIHPSAYVSARLNYAYNVSNNSVDTNLPPDFFDALQDLMDGLTPASSPAPSWLMSRSCSEVLSSSTEMVE